MIPERGLGEGQLKSGEGVRNSDAQAVSEALDKLQKESPEVLQAYAKALLKNEELPSQHNLTLKKYYYRPFQSVSFVNGEGKLDTDVSLVAKNIIKLQGNREIRLSHPMQVEDVNPKGCCIIL